MSEADEAAAAEPVGEMTTVVPAPVAPAPQLLARPGTIEIVEEGRVNLFAARVAATGETGARRYLGTFEPGDAIFVQPAATEAAFRLIAVGSAGTRVAVEQLSALAAREPADAARLVNGWILRLAAGLVGLPSPTALERVKPSSETSEIGPGRSVQPDDARVAWFRLASGKARFHSLASAVIEPGAPIAVTATGWLEATDELSVEALTTESFVALGPSALASALALHERSVLAGVAELESAERSAKDQQLRAKLKKSSYMAVEALAEIENLLREKKAEKQLSEASPLFLAVNEVGKFLGVEIRAPASTEDLERLKNPADAIARASQVRTREVVLRGGWWKTDSGPLVGTYDESKKPVALLPVRPGRYELFDPVDGSRKRVTDAIAGTLSPMALMLYRPFPDEAITPRQLVSFSTQGHRRDLATTAALAIAGAVLGLAAPQATAILIDDAIPTGDRSLLLQIAVVLVGLGLAAAGFQLSLGVLSLRVQSAADHALQAGLWDRLLRLRMSFFRQFSSGDLQTRVMAVRQIRQALSASVVKTLLTSGMSLLQLALLVYYSWKLALIAIVLFVLQTVVTSWVGVAIVRTSRELQTLEGAQFGLLVQLVSGITKLRVTGAERRAFSHWTKIYTSKQRLSQRAKALHDSISVLNAVLSMASTAVVFYAVEKLLAPGALSTGSFLAFMGAFGAFLSGASTLSETITTLLDIVNLAERAKPVLEAKPESERGRIDPGTLKGKLALDRVTFRYRTTGPLILDQVSVHADPGELVALVGESGSGKSTIVKLVLGFEFPEAGTVSFDDHDAQGLDLSAVRRQLGVVIQGGRIAAGSVFDNISEGRVISIAEAQEAIKNAGLEDDIANMPMGIHTVISEGGSNLSGGQRQRLLIARAIVTKPKILIFDEATSALDNRTQAIVNESLESLRVTRVVIAHRLSTIRQADRIYVLEKGRVAEVGTFDELAKGNGLFSRLLARQRA